MNFFFCRTEQGRIYAIECCKEQGETPVRNESHLLYRLQRALCTYPDKNIDVIKKLMYKDGHLVDNTQHYLRSRKVNHPESIMVYDNLYAVRDSAKAYNNGETITLCVEPFHRKHALYDFE